MKKLIQTTLFLALLAFMACGEGQQQAEQTPGVTDTEILLGTWGPLTGPAALWGNVMKGLDAYFQMINEEEGGIHGRQLKLIMKDDAYDPSKTGPVVRELAERHEVFAFVLGIGTGPNAVAKPYIVENNIPWISPLSGATEFTFPPQRNIFGAFALYFDEGYVQANYAVDSLGATKIACIYQNDDFGKSGLVAARETLKQRGIDMVAEVPVELTDSDLSSHVAKLKESGAEVVLLWLAPKHAAITLGTGAAMGFQPQYIASAVLSDMALMYGITKGLWKDVIFGYWGTMPSDTTDATIQKYKAAWAKYYPGESWGAFPASGFMYGELIREGLQRAGRELTRESFIQAMESIQNFQGSGPVISYGPGIRQGHRSLFLVRCISDTEYEQLTPFQNANADIEALMKLL
ncbi:MAG: ABC transporter substrate-binding protein [Bacteroidetes bacterium]|nr:MAG: ABC transporter substrate-binding protein [Bacteroidota bacterium]